LTVNTFLNTFMLRWAYSCGPKNPCYKGGKSGKWCCSRKRGWYL